MASRWQGSMHINDNKDFLIAEVMTDTQFAEVMTDTQFAEVMTDTQSELSDYETFTLYKSHLRYPHADYIRMRKREHKRMHIRQQRETHKRVLERVRRGRQSGCGIRNQI